MSRPRRWWVTGYGLMAATGVAALVTPAPSVRAAASPALIGLAYVWAAMLVIGGGSAMIGAWSERWLGEYAGLPLLAAVFGAYAVAAAASGRLSSMPAALALTAIAVLLLARWREIAVQRGAASRYRGRR